MTPRQKCGHCAKVADFHDDFCTLCWSHRTKGRVLTDEQIAACQGQYAVVRENKRWQAELGVWQNRLLVPAILMTLWCAYWLFTTLPFYLKWGFGLWETVTGALCVTAFATGGYLVGGARALKVACPVLILASLACIIHIGDYLRGAFDDLAANGRGVAFSSIRLVFCGTILVSSVNVLRLRRAAP